MSSAGLNNVTVPDTFSAAVTLSCPNTSRVRILLNNQAMFWRRGIQQPGGGGIRWEGEEFLVPGLYSFDELCDAIQVRAAIPAAQIPAERHQAQVSISTRTDGELPFVQGAAGGVTGP